MIKKKFHFSLIEIIIATSLFAILIFSTTSLFFRYQKLNAKIAMIRPAIFERTLFFEKMTEMTMTIDRSTIKSTSPKYSEYLSFTFDNGFKDLSALSGECTCEIYRTFDKELIYTISNNEGLELNRPLLTGIISFTHTIEDQILTISIKDLHKNIYDYTFLIPEKTSGSNT